MPTTTPTTVAQLMTQAMDLTGLDLQDLGIMAYKLDRRITPLEAEFYRLKDVRDEAAVAAANGTLTEQERIEWHQAIRRCEVILSNLETLKPQFEKVRARMREIEDEKFWAAVKTQQRRAGLC
jgi:hypothetical protein